MSQRNGGVRGILTFSTYNPAWLTRIRQDFPEPTFLKPEAARSLFPRLIDRNHHFWAFVERTGLDAAKNFDKAQNIDRLLRD